MFNEIEIKIRFIANGNHSFILKVAINICIKIKKKKRNFKEQVKAW